MIEHLKHLVDGEVFNGGKNIQSVDGDYFDSEFYKVINSVCTSWEDFIEKSPDYLIQNQQWICNWIYIRYRVHVLKKEWK